MITLLTDTDGPPAFDAIAEYVVVEAGAKMLTEHAFDAMPLFHEQLVGALPPVQLRFSATDVPAATGDTAVSGVCAIEQLLGAATKPA